MMSRLYIISIVLLSTIAYTTANGQGLSLTVLVNSTNIPMNSGSHFQSGNTVSTIAALRVSSNVSWDLSAKVSGNLTNGPYSIPANNIGIRVPNAPGNPQPERMFTVVDQLIVDAAPPTYLLMINTPVLLDIDLRTTGGENFMNKPAGSYSTTITYTLTAN